MRFFFFFKKKKKTCIVPIVAIQNKMRISFNNSIFSFLLFKVTVDQKFSGVLQKAFGTRVAFNRITVKLLKCRNRRNNRIYLWKIWYNPSNAKLTMLLNWITYLHIYSYHQTQTSNNCVSQYTVDDGLQKI